VSKQQLLGRGLFERSEFRKAVVGFDGEPIKYEQLPESFGTLSIQSTETFASFSKRRKPPFPGALL